MEKSNPFRTIKISNELMHLLVEKLFKVDEINRERNVQNAMRLFDISKKYTTSEIPPFSMSIKTKLDISEQDAVEYFSLLTDEVCGCYKRGYPFISLVSDNATNDLQVLINQFDTESGVTGDDISAYSNYYVFNFGPDTYSFGNK